MLLKLFSNNSADIHGFNLDATRFLKKNNFHSYFFKLNN